MNTRIFGKEIRRLKTRLNHNSNNIWLIQIRVWSHYKQN